MSQPQKTPQSPAAKRVAAYRKRMRAADLVPKTIWVPNTKDPRFIAEYRRQARSIAADTEQESEVMAWIERAQDGLDLGPIPAHRTPGDK
jgi:hypothetical protein